MEKKKRHKRIKIIKVVFTVLTVVTLISTSIISVFASYGLTRNDEYIYEGNVEFTLTPNYNFYDEDTESYIETGCSIGICPIISNSMIDNNTNISGYTEVDNTFYIDNYTSNINMTDGLFTAIPSIGEAWECQCNYYIGMPNTNYLNYIQIEARDFYFYLNSEELTEELFGDAINTLAESALHIKTDEMYADGAHGIIYYTEAGKEDDANNRQIHEYDVDALVTTDVDEISPNYFQVLPTDETFDGLYTDSQLIYIEYLNFIIPIEQEVEYIGINVYYTNAYYNFRNDDLSEYELPISPIDPGIFADYTSWLATAVSGFLDFQIVQGFTLGGIVMVLIAFMMCLWFLKVFAGG